MSKKLLRNHSCPLPPRLKFKIDSGYISYFCNMIMGLNPSFIKTSYRLPTLSNKKHLNEFRTRLNRPRLVYSHFHIQIDNTHTKPQLMAMKLPEYVSLVLMHPKIT